MYLYGYSTQQIADALTEMGKVTYRGNAKWSAGTVLQVLRNERYCGDVYTRKTFTPDRPCDAFSCIPIPSSASVYSSTARFFSSNLYMTISCPFRSRILSAPSCGFWDMIYGRGNWRMVGGVE